MRFMIVPARPFRDSLKVRRKHLFSMMNHIMLYAKRTLKGKSDIKKWKEFRLTRLQFQIHFRVSLVQAYIEDIT